MSILIAILVIFVIAAVAFWIVDQIPLPYPFPMVAKVVIGVLALVALLQRAGWLGGLG